MSAPALLGWTPGQWMAVMRHFQTIAPDIENALELRKLWEERHLPLEFAADDPYTDATTALFLKANEDLRDCTEGEYTLSGPAAVRVRRKK